MSHFVLTIKLAICTYHSEVQDSHGAVLDALGRLWLSISSSHSHRPPGTKGSPEQLPF